jgi:hypothetical protein
MQDDDQFFVPHEVRTDETVHTSTKVAQTEEAIQQ